MTRQTQTAEQTKAADLKWLNKAEHWGEWERFDEVTGDRESIWMLKSTTGPQVRFYAKGKGEVSRHPHVVAATYWAYGTGYLQVCDPNDIAAISLNVACRAEVMAGGAPADRHTVSA